MLEKKDRLNYLFDFYGMLLTKKQQAVVEMYYQDDFSLAEVAQHLRISRQGVYDILSRAVHALEEWEEKMGLYRSFMRRREEGKKLLELLAIERPSGAQVSEIRKIVEKNMLEN